MLMNIPPALVLIVIVFNFALAKSAKSGLPSKHEHIYSNCNMKYCNWPELIDRHKFIF